jgi:hypothetical protein
MDHHELPGESLFAHNEKALPTPRPAMTASSAISLAPSLASPAPASLEWLDLDLQQRLALAAGSAGLDATEACKLWVREGLERLEAEQAAAETAGRCSLRTGSCTTGPVPLPVQQ